MTISNDEKKIFLQVLKKSPLRIGKNTVFTLMPVQSTHRIYTFEAENKTYVIKKFIEESFTQLNRPAIFNAQKDLASQGFAPIPVWIDCANGVWIEEYVSSQNVVLKPAQNQSLLGAVLAELHTIKIDTKLILHIDLPAQWQHYLEHLSHSEQAKWQQVIKQGIDDYNRLFDAEPRVLCHNDLSLGHILSHDPLIVVDWEYLAWGNRYFDIASAISINQIPLKQAHQVIESYAEKLGRSAQEVFNCVQAMKLCTQITNGLWYEAKNALPL